MSKKTVYQMRAKGRCQLQNLAAGTITEQSVCRHVCGVFRLEDVRMALDCNRPAQYVTMSDTKCVDKLTATAALDLAPLGLQSY